MHPSLLEGVRHITLLEAISEIHVQLKAWGGEILIIALECDSLYYIGQSIHFFVSVVDENIILYKSNGLSPMLSNFTKKKKNNIFLDFW